MIKNLACVGFTFLLMNKGTGEPITDGAPFGFVTIDGGTQSTLSGIPVHKGNGEWAIDLLAAETNGDMVGLTFYHIDAVPVHFTINTIVQDAGVGPIAWTYTLTDSGTGLPISDADVWITEDIAGATVLASGTTDINGVARFWLDAGTIYVWVRKTGYAFGNPSVEVVTA